MSAPETDDCQLARAARAGSRAAFGQLVDRHHQAVFGFLLALTRHRQDAEDLTQDTFVRAWRKIHHLDPRRPLRPWLFTLARRLSIAMLRKRKPDPEPESLVAETPTPSSDLWRLAERSLSRDAFSAIWLHYHDGFSHAEIGAVLGKRPGAVKVMLHRARQTLHEQLKRRPPRLPAAPPPRPSIWNVEASP